MPGKLIVFEGVEGAGKTTQIQRSQILLQQSLPPNIPILVTREPGGTDLGVGIRRLLLEDQSPHNRAELLLYAADRAQHVEGVLQPALAKGTVILCDRYTDSTIAYQGYGRGLDLKLIEQLNQIATEGLESHLTLWLDVNVETGLQRARRRGSCDRIERADLTFHQRVRQGFVELAARFPHRIVRIDANLPEDRVWQQIEKVLLAMLSSEF